MMKAGGARMIDGMPHIHPPHEGQRAKVFEDRLTRGDWRVEREDEDGSIEVAIFSGPNARQRMLRYADRQYGDFEEIVLAPYR